MPIVASVAGTIATSPGDAGAVAVIWAALGSSIRVGKGKLMAALTLLGIFTKDIVKVSSFYRDLFGFRELEHLSSDIFRGLDTGKIWLGFNAHAAYGLLHMEPYAQTQGNKFTLNFEVDSVDDVDRIFALACDRGATPVMPPTAKRYNDSAGTHWYLAVLLDPEGNAFRLSHPIT